MGDSPINNTNDPDPFYVGYLPLPKSIKRFLVPWLVANIVVGVGIAAVVAQQHREPGDGTWDTGQAVTLDGFLSVDPYPLLKVDGKTYILVEQGKRGVQDRLVLDAIKAGRVSATGFLIERNGRSILELDGSLDAPLANTTAFNSVTQSGNENQSELVSRANLQEISRHINSELSQDLGTHTLTGEIVDPKCYLGVMQPGDGKTHKICATLCITGGIPPMFLVRDRDGNTAAYLLTDANGNAVPESIYPYIADPVELTGRVFHEGDLLVLRADLSTIRRLDASN